MTPESKRASYEDVFARIRLLLDEETDWIAGMATVVCELNHAFEYYHWTGFYRTVRPRHLKIGPYQGGHGCIDIPFSRGVCGAAARTARTQLIDDVSLVPEHIACSASTRSEIVVPVVLPSGEVIAVLDVDSDWPSAFDHEDQMALESLCKWLGETYGGSTGGL